jgi:hypothetical protein
VAVPAASRSLLGQQHFMMNIQAPAGVKFTPLTPSSSSTPHHVASPTAAAVASPMRQQGSAGRQHLPQQQQQQLLSALVTAWQELVVMLHNMRLKGLYCLLPDLVGAVEAGDADAAYAFKNVSVLCRVIVASVGGSAGFESLCNKGGL